MSEATKPFETSYVLLFSSVLGLLVGIALLVYGWPQPCGPFIPCPNVYPYYIVDFGVLIMVLSVGLMVYSIRNHAH
jgi:hypothetical protein